MKRNEWMAIIATSFLMFALCLSATAQNNKPVYNKQGHTPHGCRTCPCMERYYVDCLDDATFAKLYDKVRRASFNDNKFDLLEVAGLGCYYSCEQTARMIKLFTFSDDQLKVLRLMAPRIIDPQNAIIIYNLFSFDSEKVKAGEIILKDSTR